MRAERAGLAVWVLDEMQAGGRLREQVPGWHQLHVFRKAAKLDAVKEVWLLHVDDLAAAEGGLHGLDAGVALDELLVDEGGAWGPQQGSR